MRISSLLPQEPLSVRVEQRPQTVEPLVFEIEMPLPQQPQRSSPEKGRFGLARPSPRLVSVWPVVRPVRRNCTRSHSGCSTIRRWGAAARCQSLFGFGRLTRLPVLDLSRICAVPSARLCDLAFEGQGGCLPMLSADGAGYGSR